MSPGKEQTAVRLSALETWNRHHKDQVLGESVAFLGTLEMNMRGRINTIALKRLDKLNIIKIEHHMCRIPSITLKG